MATTVTIYPTSLYWHTIGPGEWSALRDSIDSDSVNSTNPGSVGIVFDRGYTFYRIYLGFTLSSIPEGSVIDSITISVKRLDEIKFTYSPYIAYSGRIMPTSRMDEYSLYLDNLSRGESLASVTIPDNESYYTSGPFNLATYPVSAGDILAVGIIDPDDFDNNVESFSDRYLFDIDKNLDRPYIEVTYTEGGGYNKPVMGISNFTNLNGIPSANIVSVMGVI